jgi:hypothetical protein
LSAVGSRATTAIRKDVVHSNFRDPRVTDSQRTKLIRLSQGILDARSAHTPNTLSDLYDDVTMPAKLRTALYDLDRFVDKLYRANPSAEWPERAGFLFALHEATEKGKSI